VAWSESANGISRSKFANLLFDNCSPSPRPVEGLKVLSREVICFHVVIVVTTKSQFISAKFSFFFTKKLPKKKIAQISKIKIMKSRTKSSSTSAASITATTKTAATCDSSKHYPSISAAYWLPAPNPTPYLLPGNIE
jgi:GTP cyclohydrolase FolE2